MKKEVIHNFCVATEANFFSFRSSQMDKINKNQLLRKMATQFKATVGNSSKFSNCLQFAHYSFQRPRDEQPALLSSETWIQSLSLEIRNAGQSFDLAIFLLGLYPTGTIL